MPNPGYTVFFRELFKDNMFQTSQSSFIIESKIVLNIVNE